MTKSSIIKIQCDIHLIRFMEFVYGEQPIKFRAGKNRIVDLIEYSAQQPPEDFTDVDYGTKSLSFEIKYSEYHYTDFTICNYLSPKGQKVILNHINSYFETRIRYDINRFLSWKDKMKKKSIIDLVINRYNLPENSTGIIENLYQKERKLRWKIKSAKLTKKPKK